MLPFIRHKHSNLIILHHSREFHSYRHCSSSIIIWIMHRWYYLPSLIHYNGSNILWEMKCSRKWVIHTLTILFTHGLDMVGEKLSKPEGRLDVRVESNPSLRPKAFEAGFSNLILASDLMSLYFSYTKN
jgi:hypothetical protein